MSEVKKRAPKPLVDHTGKKYGRLTYIRDLPELSTYRNRRAEFRCDCGVVKNIAMGKAVSGDTQSCGCLRSEVRHKQGRAKAPCKNMRKCRDCGDATPNYFRCSTCLNSHRVTLLAYAAECEV